MRRIRTLVAVLGAIAVTAACASSQGAPRAGDRNRSDQTAPTAPPSGSSPRVSQSQTIALAAAHREADERPASAVDSTGWPANIDSVSFVEQPNTVADSNTGHPCDSATVFVIKLIGTFDNIAVAPPPEPATGPPRDDTVHAIIASADTQSGLICLVGVQTGIVHPAAGSTILFQR